MKAIISGATGKTEQHTWQQTLKQGYKVTVFVRSLVKKKPP